MTYKFFCRFFKPSIAAWATALWFAFVFMILFALSSYDEPGFIYMNF